MDEEHFYQRTTTGKGFGRDGTTTVTVVMEINRGHKGLLVSQDLPPGFPLRVRVKKDRQFVGDGKRQRVRRRTVHGSSVRICVWSSTVRSPRCLDRCCVCLFAGRWLWDVGLRLFLCLVFALPVCHYLLLDYSNNTIVISRNNSNTSNKELCRQ